MTVESATRTAALRADCTRCRGWCCVVPAFETQQGFGFDKAAHQACTHLTPERRCDIHAERAARGFSACVGFDCYGAGQRLTRELGCGDIVERVSPEAALQIFRAYPNYRALHELMAWLDLALTRHAVRDPARLEQALEEIEALCAAGPDAVAHTNTSVLRIRVKRLLREHLVAAAASVAADV